MSAAKTDRDPTPAPAPLDAGTDAEMTAPTAGRKVAAKAIEAGLVLGFLAFAFVILRHELSTITWTSVRTSIRELPITAVAIALGVTAVNFVILTGYDSLAIRYVGVRLRYWQVALASMVGYAFSQGFGFPLLTGAPIRYRLYSTWGLSAYDIGRIIAFYAFSFWLGYAVVAGIAFLFLPIQLPGIIAVPPHVLRVVGAALLTGIVVYVMWTAFGKRELGIRKFKLRPPTLTSALLQLTVAVLDWTAAATVLWVLLPPDYGVGVGPFFTAFLLAHFVGVISHVPGGLGVFEAVFLSLTESAAGSGAVTASLVVFRFVYYVIPMLLGGGALIVHEFLRHRRTVETHLQTISQWTSQVVPAAAAVVTFFTGAILLLSGSIPIPSERLRVLTGVLPLGLLELSHFMGSIVGMTLIILARGLQRRLNGAYHVTQWLLLLGIVLSMVRGVHPSTALVMGAAALILYISREAFFRPTSMLDEPFSVEWILAITTVFVTTVWLGFFAFRHVAYSQDLWWRVAVDDNAPRFLRSVVGAAVLALGFSIARLLRTAPHRTDRPSPAELANATALIAQGKSADANLVYVGDKDILQSPSGHAFLMFAVRQRSWIVMGDPVGDETEFHPLLWDFRDRVDRAGGTPVFYQVGADLLPLYIDLGLAFNKIGENARVNLPTFSLEGKKRADLRQAVRKMERANATFEVIPRERVPSILPMLRSVSDEWLEAKNVREKGFSVGRFADDYVTRFPVAVLRIDQRIVAFATLWSAGLSELSVDLMRHTEDSPNGVMDGMFTHVILWGKEQGYQWFGLGVAPLSGMETHRLAPSWHRVGHLVFKYGEYFYNFQGLRAYKEKFDPEWEPRYLAAPPGLSLARALADVTAMISGGVRGIVMR